MVAFNRNGRDGETMPGEFCIRLSIAPCQAQASAALRLCRAIESIGGNYVGDGRFRFTSGREGRMALRVLSKLVGGRFFEPAEPDGPAERAAW
jgi:hypothetical protein